MDFTVTVPAESTDREENKGSHSGILVYTDMAPTYVAEPQPIDLGTYIEGTVKLLSEDPINDPSSFKTKDITLNGIAGSQIRYLASGLPMTVNFLVGAADDPELFCGSTASIVQGIAVTPQQQTTIDEILNSLKVLPTSKGDLRSCADRSQLSALEQEAGQLELIEWDIEADEYGGMDVVGVVENNTSEDLAFVTISFAVYDADGFKLGTTEDIIESLGAGEKWKFKAMVYQEGAAEVKVDSLEGF